MEEFTALQRQVEELSRQVAFLTGMGTQWMDRKQAMQALNVSESTLHKLMRDMKLPHRYEGRKPLFSAEGIRAYIKSTCVHIS